MKIEVTEVSWLDQSVEYSLEELAERMERLALNESGEPVVRAFRAFERIDWSRATMGGRLVLLTDASNTIISTQPALNGYIGRKLNEAIGRDAAVAQTAIIPGVSEMTLTDGSSVLLARRNLGSPLGQLAITQRRAVLLGEWRAVTDATDQAATAAQAAGIDLGKIVELQVSASGYPYPYPLEAGGVGSTGATACRQSGCFQSGSGVACPASAPCPPGLPSFPKLVRTIVPSSDIEYWNGRPQPSVVRFIKFSLFGSISSDPGITLLVRAYISIRAKVSDMAVRVISTGVI
jgi:hypothetical protein